MLLNSVACDLEETCGKANFVRLKFGVTIFTVANAKFNMQTIFN